MITRPSKLEPLVVVATAQHLGITLRRQTVNQLTDSKLVSVCIKEDLLRAERQFCKSFYYLRLTGKGHYFLQRFNHNLDVDLDRKLECEPGEPIQKFTTNWSDTKHFARLLDFIEATGREEFTKTELLRAIGFQMLDESRTSQYMFRKSKKSEYWIVGGKALAGLKLRKPAPQPREETDEELGLA